MSIRLVVGLGNPGRRYAATRHNVGFRVVDAIAAREQASWQAAASFVWTVSRGGLMLVKPSTFMNRSGAAVEAVMAAEGCRLDELLVVVDDVDLPLGRLRLKQRGGPGTHNGLRDVVDRVGTDFGRLRIGVRGDEPWSDLAGYVLSPFSGGEAELVEEAIEGAVHALSVLSQSGWAEAMSGVNRRPERDDSRA